MPIHTRACSHKTLQILQVFLDEVNTSSCLGLFKEIIVDRSFDGNVSGFTVLQSCYVVPCNVSCNVNIEHSLGKPPFFPSSPSQTMCSL